MTGEVVKSQGPSWEFSATTKSETVCFCRSCGLTGGTSCFRENLALGRQDSSFSVIQPLWEVGLTSLPEAANRAAALSPVLFCGTVAARVWAAAWIPLSDFTAFPESESHPAVPSRNSFSAVISQLTSVAYNQEPY